MTAKTELFQRIEAWRKNNGRDPKTGRRINSIDPKHLVVIALRAQAERTHRNDLRPIYLELAELFTEEPKP